jgi:hypothetical protein
MIVFSAIREVPKIPQFRTADFLKRLPGFCKDDKISIQPPCSHQNIINGVIISIWNS